MKLLLLALIVTLSIPSFAQEIEEESKLKSNEVLVIDNKIVPEETLEESRTQMQKQDERDPLGEYDTGNGKTTNKKVKWPAP